MAVYKPIKVTSLPAAPLAENAVYFVKGTTDTRIKMYVTDTSGTAFLVGITSESEVLSTLLNGFTVGSNTTIASSDSILGAFGKTQGQINALATAVNEGIKVPVPIDCSTNPNYPASTKGDSYLVTAAGRIGGASGIIVDVGDKIICLTTNAGGTQASVGSNFYILESNFNILSIAKGGTNSSTALNNNRVMVSSSGSIREATAITANRALISNESGIPVHSSVTNTQLGHLSGVTSNIQTQLNGKEPSFTKNTGFNKNFGTTAGTVAEGNDSRFHNAVTLGTANGLSLVGQELSLSLSSTSTTGALSSTDWNTFNNKLTSLLNSTNIFVGSSSNVATARALSLNATGGTFGLSNTGVLTFPNASTNTRGLLTSADWNTFNSKENVLTFSTGLSRSGNTITNTITQYTDALARASISLTTTGTTGSATYNSTTGVFNIPQYQGALTNPVTGTGTAGQVSFWNGTTTQTGDSKLTFNSSTGLLTLNGDLQLTGAKTITTSTDVLTLATGGGNGNIILSPNGTGNVGIGSAPVNAKLFINAANGGNNGIRIITDNNVNGFLQFGDTDNNSVGRIIYKHIDDSMGFFTNSTEKLSITSAGDIGINTTTPTEKLDIDGNIRVRTLGTTPGDIVTANSNGVLSRRTSSELLNDIGAVPTGRTLTLSGTTNQVNISSPNVQDLSANRTWTLSLPQNIHTGATPTFAGLTVNGNITLGGSVQRQINMPTSIIRDNGAQALILSVNSGSIFLRPAGDSSTTGQIEITETVTQYTGARTIRTTTGDLTIATLAGDGNIILSPHGNGQIQVNAPIGIRASTGSTATHIPVFTADPSSTIRTLVTRTPAQLLDDIGAVPTGRTLTLIGTTNQVNVSQPNTQDLSSNRTWTLSLPQDIHPVATPTFAGLTVNGNIGLANTITASGTAVSAVFGARTRHTPITAPTTGLNAGDMYYDSTSNRMRFRRTSDWVEMGMLWDTVGW